MRAVQVLKTPHNVDALLESSTSNAGKTVVPDRAVTTALKKGSTVSSFVPAACYHGASPPVQKTEWNWCSTDARTYHAVCIQVGVAVPVYVWSPGSEAVQAHRRFVLQAPAQR